jgi:hypothetical protein
MASDRSLYKRAALEPASHAPPNAHQPARPDLRLTGGLLLHLRRVVELMGQEAEMLSGEVEADETYYGAKRKRGTPRGRPGPDSHKTPIMGIVERKG